jgi:hypothetical protein
MVSFKREQQFNPIRLYIIFPLNALSLTTEYFECVCLCVFFFFQRRSTIFDIVCCRKYVENVFLSSYAISTVF